MNFEEIQHYLEPENIGRAPISLKLSILLLIFMIVIGLGLFYDTNDQQVQLEKHERKEMD